MKTIRLILLVVASLATLDVFSQTPCTSCSTQSCATVSLSITGNNGVVYNNPTIPWVQGINVTVAMYNAQSAQPFNFTTTQYCPYGSFVASVNGISQQGSSYWALYINGAYANFGMDYQQLNAGDAVSFVYTPSSKLKVTESMKGSHQMKFVAQLKKE